MNIFAIGATSEILRETLRFLVTADAKIFLVGRSSEKIAFLTKDLNQGGVSQVYSELIDLDKVELHPKLIETAWKQLGTVDLVIIAHGVFFNQRKMENFAQDPIHLFQTNLLSPVSLILNICLKLESQRHGQLAVFSSAAGERGRASNYIYGAAKGGLSVFLQGVRSRLYRSGIVVTTIKLGPVKTQMTAELGKLPFMIKPSLAGKIVANGIVKKRDIVYVPKIFSLITFLLKICPERLAKRFYF